MGGLVNITLFIMTAASGLWTAQNQISYPKSYYALLLPGCSQPENFITHNAQQDQLHKSNTLFSL